MNEPTSTTLELRPMGIGDILDTTLRMYKNNFASFVSIALITYVPYSIVMFLLHSRFDGPVKMIDSPLGPMQAPDAATTGVNYAGMAILILFVYPLTQGALMTAFSGGFLGQSVGAAEAYGRAFKRGGALIGTQILVGFVVLVGTILLVVPGIIFSLWFMIVPAIVVLEQLSGSAAMSRGRALMKGNLGKGFVLTIVVNLLVIVIVLAAIFLANMLISTLALPPAIYVFAENLITAILLPVQLGAIILLYYDLRIRKEAFDLQMLSDSMPGGEPTPA